MKNIYTHTLTADIVNLTLLLMFFHPPCTFFIFLLAQLKYSVLGSKSLKSFARGCLSKVLVLILLELEDLVDPIPEEVADPGVDSELVLLVLRI